MTFYRFLKSYRVKKTEEGKRSWGLEREPSLPLPPQYRTSFPQIFIKGSKPVFAALHVGHKETCNGGAG